MEPILRAALGLAFFIGLAWLMSSHKRRIEPRVIVGGLLMQVFLAFIILKTGPGRGFLESLSEGVTKFLGFAQRGAAFVFGGLEGFHYTPPPVDGAPPEPTQWFAAFPYHLPGEGVNITFAFSALTTIIFFSAVMAILYHIGIMQLVIFGMAKFMTWAMRVSGAESLAMAANVFVGQTEAPLVVRPYIAKMTRSELMAMMTGGFATIAGSVLAVYIGCVGADNAGHLLAASFMSAPAAFMIAKVLVPETEVSNTGGKVELRIERTATNVLDAAATGTSDGLKLFLNVAAMLIAFVALIALIDWPLSLIEIDDAPLTLKRIFGWVFAPVAWMIGVAWEDCQNFGALLGTKVAVNEFVAFSDLSTYTADGTMSERSRLLAAYALCGFANFASIGIQIGGISPLAPERRGDIAKLAMRAMIGGAFASWMTATIAGAFISDAAS